jgi:hypothetical protein
MTMKKTLALACLLVVFAAPLAAQTGPPPMCGIGHTDVTTGEFVCDDLTTGGTTAPTAQTDGIGHTDDDGDAAASLVTLVVIGVSALVSSTGY